MAYKSIRMIAIILVALSLSNVFAVKSVSSEPLVPLERSCQNMQTSIQIIDESGGEIPNKTFETLEDSTFKRYVSSTSQHVFTKVSEMSKRQGTKDCPEVTLFFVYRSLLRSTNAPIKEPFKLERLQSSDARNLESPWVKLSVSQSPQLVVKATFVWSERQFLVDQAMISGINVTPIKELFPIDERIFRQYVNDYTQSVILAPIEDPLFKSLAQEYLNSTRMLRNDLRVFRQLVRQYTDPGLGISIFYKTSASQNTLLSRFPPDILWLFRFTLRNFKGFNISVDGSHSYIVQFSMLKEYGDLTKFLVDQFFKSTKTEMRYGSIFDLEVQFSVDRYQERTIFE